MSDSLRPPWAAACQGPLSFTVSQSLLSQSLLKLRSTESMMPSNHLILCRPLLLLPSIFPSIRVFSNELALHIRWAKYLCFSFNNSPSLPMKIQGWFPLGLTGFISLLSKGLSRVFFNTTIQKHQFFVLNLLHGPNVTSIHNYWKSHSFNGPLSAKWYLCFLICCLGLS